MSKPIYRKWWFILLSSLALLFILFIVIGLIVTSNPEYQKKMDDLKKLHEFEERKKISQLESSKQKDSIQKLQDLSTNIKLDTLLLEEISRIKQSNFIEYLGNKEKIYEGIQVFDKWNDIILKYKDSPDAQVQNLLKKMRKELIAKQVYYFPIFRVMYANIIRHDLWLKNISINLSGKNSTIITFVSYIFANNENIENFFNEVSVILSDLRFQRVNFKWHASQNDYTYYPTYALKDNELLEIQLTTK